MKCSVCGHRSNTIAAMSKHYRQKHPSRMKIRRSKKQRATSAAWVGMMAGKYCPHCGEKL